MSCALFAAYPVSFSSIRSSHRCPKRVRGQPAPHQTYASSRQEACTWCCVPPSVFPVSKRPNSPEAASTRLPARASLPSPEKGHSALRLDRQDCLISTGETWPKAPALPRQPFNRPGFDGREQMTAEKNPKTPLASPKVLWQKPPHSGRHR